MAKFEVLFEDVEKLFNDVIDITDLNHLVNFKVIANNKLTTIGKVQKANDLLNYLGDGVDVIITVNQLVFDQLPQEMQEMVAIELLTYVGYDSEKEKVIIKGNVDAELVLHVMVQYKNFDKAIIISGDGDFHCLVEYLDEKNKLLKVLTPTKHYSSLLRKFNNKKYIVRIDMLKKSLEQKKTGIRGRSKP